MTYDANETSVQDGAPIECYLFAGTYTSWKYTSYPQSVTVNSQVFTPEVINRDRAKVATQAEQNTQLEVTLPFDNEMVRAYAFDQAPPDLNLTIYRAHEGDLANYITMWRGAVQSISIEGRTAKLVVPNIFARILDGNTTSPRYQAPCNHVFLDARCGLDPALFSSIATVTSIADNVVQVASHGYADNACAAGKMVLSSGEARMIVSHVGTSFTVSYPFSTGLEVGDTVTLFRGCDHSFTTCRGTFSNGINFGGHSYVPEKNPFTSGI